MSLIKSSTAIFSIIKSTQYSIQQHVVQYEKVSADGCNSSSTRLISGLVFVHNLYCFPAHWLRVVGGTLELQRQACILPNMSRPSNGSYLAGCG